MAPKKAPDVHIAPIPAKPPKIHINLRLHPTAQAEGLEAVQQAQGLAITDKESQAAVKAAVKVWKQRRKAVEEWHREEILRPLAQATDWGREQMNDELTRFDAAIAIGDKLDLGWTHDRRRIEAAEAEERRRKAEADETARREKAAADAEAAALQLEASSNVLSEREQYVVARIVNKKFYSGTALPNDWLAACKGAAYRDPSAAVQKLVKSEKIGAAVDAGVKALRIRAEAEAAKAKPVIVDVPQVESQIVDGGMRVYYSCSEDVDVMALAKAVVAGKVHVLALSPNLPYLNTQAKALKSLFPAAFDGCQLSKREGTVSR